MQNPIPAPHSTAHHSGKRPLLGLLTAVTLATLTILWSFYAVALWAGILAMLFQPLHQGLLRRFPSQPWMATTLPLLAMLVCVILPLTFLLQALGQQVTQLVDWAQSGALQPGQPAQSLYMALPEGLHHLLGMIGIENFDQLKARTTALTARASQLLLTRSLSVGHDTLELVMHLLITLYLSYFFLRDGPALRQAIFRATPLSDAHKRHLAQRFKSVIRATVYGGFTVALVQGVLGGLAFWFLGIQGALLWTVVMGLCSLVPAVGAALVWGPVAIYLGITGEHLQAIALVGWGVLVIGMVDNLLRPLLVGKDAGMADYLVLLSTLGAMPLFGLHGFVIGPLVASMFFAVWSLYLAQVSEDTP